MSTDYRGIASELTGLVGKLGLTKSELQTVIDAGGAASTATAAATSALEAAKKVRDAVSKAELPGAERERKIKELQSDIELLRIVLGTEHDLQTRVEAQREVGRLSARLGVYMSQTVLHFNDLLDSEKNEIGLFLEEAARDIAARDNLRRVLKGVEVVLRVGAFSATLAAKLAAGA